MVDVQLLEILIMKNNNSVSVLAQKALLVQLRINQWSGIKQDAKARATVESAHKTEMKVGNYQKQLLPNSKELAAIRNVAQNIRQFVDRQTLPWYADGTRILSSMHYMEFTEQFRKRKQQYDETVNEFLTKYVDLKDQAKTKLGDLYNEYEYPSVEALKYAFDCQVNFMPVPDVSDFRVEISEAEKERFVNTMKQVETEAKVEVYSRLKDVIRKAAEKLAEPDAIFRDSLIGNINDMLNLVPALNVTEDQDLNRLRDEIHKVTSTIVPEECREIKAVRENTAKQLSDIVDKMSVFMVG
jgi:hypothetical protein